MTDMESTNPAAHEPKGRVEGARKESVLRLDVEKVVILWQ
jgi:hypothetical protein